MQLNYPEHLPVSGRRKDIIKAIQDHQVVVVAGDTGSGKTTQLPKICLEAGAGRRGRIGCTQPRRIAAVSVADRVGEELAAPELVGYKIRFHDHTGPATRIKFMTDGILLAETRNDRRLMQYDTIIVDEAHERSLNIDFLLGYLHQLLQKRSELKIIISSATIDTEKFSRHFDSAPVIEVSGRTYPIKYQYAPPEGEDDDSDQTMVERAVQQTVHLADRPGGGDILVFMPTERDIMDTVKLLNKKLVQPALVLPLFGRLRGTEQRKIFHPSTFRKIIIATNVAETSLTVPGIRAVVDTGLARIAHYNVRAGTTSLPVTRVSRASCDQRAGRCGRTGPGTCIRLYSEEDYLSRPDFTQPEILRSNLAEVILQMISLHLGDPRTFPFVDPPAARTIQDGYRTLRELGAITVKNRLTARGGIMAGLPLDPRISRMIIEGAELGALREITIIAAALTIKDPRIQPVEQLEKARNAHRQFNQPGSDVLTFVNLWHGCKQTMQGKQPAAGLRRFCKTNYCSWQRMREWFDIHDQILRILRQHREFAVNSQPASADAVHQALCAGFLRNIGFRKEKNTYRISGNREVILFPGSVLFNQGGPWIVAVDFVHTSQLFARMVATIDPRWLERLAGDLCKRSWSDPHWQKKPGQVIAYEKVSLFGLIIVAGRRVNYAGVGKAARQEAREIFIRQALVCGELGGSFPFLQHNLALLRRFEEMEVRLRRRGITMDDQILYEFYDQRLGMVYDRKSLTRLLKKEQSDAFLWMADEDICRARPDSDELYRFPDSLQTGSGTLQFHYHFQPGHEEDGITVDIPVHLVSALSPSLFEWLVPGLLEEKILFLLKGLPKRLRRLLVPLPGAVDRIMDGLDHYRDSLYPALEEIIFRQFQVRIKRSDWQADLLPPHLRMRFRLCDTDGKTLHCGRNFHELNSFGSQTGRPGKAKTGNRLPERFGITDWDYQTAPQPVTEVDGNNRIISIAYPSLVIDQQNSCLSLCYIRDRERAGQQNRDGLRYLYGLRFAREIKLINKECKAASATHSASWISLGMKATAAQTKSMLSACILDGLFQNHSGELPDRKQVESMIKRLEEQGILKQARAFLDQILDLLTTRRTVQATLNQVRQRTAKNHSYNASFFDRFQILLDELLGRDFLIRLRPEQVADKKRYLQGLALRIERAEHAPAKDMQKDHRLQSVLKRLQQLEEYRTPSLSCQQEIALYRRMIEEFRVSIFAPELGTGMVVSEKRINKQWQRLESCCRSVE